MRNVLFIGDINVDIVMGGLKMWPLIDKEITCETFEITMGSTAVFAACAYALLGGNSFFLGLAGNDDYGTFMIQGMKEFGIDTHFVQFTDQVKTGVTVNLIYQDSRTQITYPGTIAELGIEHIDPTAFQQVNHVHFAGIYQQHKLQPDLTQLLMMAKNQGVTTSLDPQWDETERWEGLEEWLPLLSYVLINEDEALSITGADCVENAWKMLSGKTSCPIIKAGKKGCLVGEENGMAWIPAFPVEVVDTVGAGDAFAAGFLFGKKVKGKTIPEAARFGNAVGARNCMSVGGINTSLDYQTTIQFMEESDECI
jgi:sugar/nucleoside kinase (ribokinase family)